MSSQSESTLDQALAELATQLRLRVAVIEDHAWRDRDASAHLAALQEVSEKIAAWTLAHRSEVDPQLRHYLANSSLQKALSHLEGLADSSKRV